MRIVFSMCVGSYLFLYTLVQAAGLPVESPESRCTPPSSDEAIVYSSDFRWGMTLPEMEEKFQEMYIEGKRLKGRVFFNGQNFVLPVNTFGNGIQHAKLSKEFIQNITDHIEQGLKNKYVNYIMFPDMGHSHIFIPNKFYQEELSNIPSDQKHIRYEKMFAHKGIRVLYHTAEQLKVKDENKELLKDRTLQWRFYTRNLVGFNDGSKRIELINFVEDGHNTARSYHPGYRYWGAGFNITATSKGCFPFTHNGKTYYFDLSLEDLAPNATTSNGGFDF